MPKDTRKFHSTGFRFNPATVITSNWGYADHYLTLHREWHANIEQTTTTKEKP